MNNRPSVVVLMFRYFVTIFILMFLVSMFWNGLSGTNMFPFKVVIGVSVVLTVLFNVVGWIVVTFGQADRDAHVANRHYQFTCLNREDAGKWLVADGVRVPPRE